MVEWASEGKQIIRARAMGLTTARNVAQAWLKHGLEESGETSPPIPEGSNKLGEGEVWVKL